MIQSDIKAMLARTSVRSYRDREIDPAALDELRGLVQRPRTGPFGNLVRFALVDQGRAGREARRLGTYGVIRGASRYLAAAVAAAAPHAMEDAGYCLEQAVVRCTRLGLGTCWLGGSFDRTGFARAIGLREGEVLPCVTPVGHAADGRALLDRMARALAGSDGRKPWDQLFFEGDASHPMAEDAGDPIHDILRCVRAAPSASNRQPWRIVRDASGALHLFLARTRGYGRWFPGVDLQLIDIGIAMCHLSLAAAESGLDGRWRHDGRTTEMPGLEYIACWERIL
jgi:nitroreductase